MGDCSAGLGSDPVRCERILVYGFGNPGRRDDGLGVALAEQIGRRCEGIEVETAYQLNVEDALRLSRCDAVVFVDASRNSIDSFQFSRVQPTAKIAFTTHAMAPGSVLALCEELYHHRPATYLLEIRGEEWEMAEEPSGRGTENLARALAFLEPLLQSRDTEAFDRAANPS